MLTFNHLYSIFICMSIKNPDDKIRVAIIGVGNCASSLVQGLDFYRFVDQDSGIVPGIANNVIWKRDSNGKQLEDGYLIRDIEVVAAFDVDSRKVGKPLNEAIFTNPPNNSNIFCPDIRSNNVIVRKGALLDGLGEYLKEVVPVDCKQKEEDVVKNLIDTETDIVINYLPSGSQKATEFYAQCSIDAGCHFVNSIPIIIANDFEWRKKFADKGLIVVGDDIKSQLGSTLVHTELIDLFVKRGVKINKTYKINIGGNNDFLNLDEQKRTVGKVFVKDYSIQSLAKEYNIIQSNPSVYWRTNNDNKTCHISIEGIGFGNNPVRLDLTLNVDDSPNSAGVMVDIVRLINHCYHSTEINSKYFKHFKEES